MSKNISIEYFAGFAIAIFDHHHSNENMPWQSISK